MDRLAMPPRSAALVTSLLAVLFGGCRAQCPNMCNGRRHRAKACASARTRSHTSVAPEPVLPDEAGILEQGVLD